MKTLEQVFQDLLQEKSSLEETLKALKAVAQENNCPKCGNPIKITYQPNGKDDFNKTAFCDYCGSDFSE